MKTLKIEFIPKLDGAQIVDAANFFEQNLSFEYIDMLNWPVKFPYKPDTRFKIARSTSSLFIHFKVIEKDILARYSQDQDPVWQDSCVEFFCKIPNQKSYYNFEINCIGTCLATKRDGRDENVIPLSAEQMAGIKRYASLGNEPFDAKTGVFEWKLTVEIPLNLIGIDSGSLPDGILANFYKCADESSEPHYVSWNLIATPNPDFHRPEFFGELQF